MLTSLFLASGKLLQSPKYFPPTQIAYNFPTAGWAIGEIHVQAVHKFSSHNQCVVCYSDVLCWFLFHYRIEFEELQK